MISAVIFDMDGLLIDSEPVWRKAEVRVFNLLGVPLTEDRCSQTMGLRLDEVVRHWHEQYPWGELDVEEVAEDILNEMEEQLRRHTAAMPGAHQLISFFQNREVRLALATSSYMRLVNVVLEQLALSDAFEVVRSAQFEKRGKPHPDVFLTTAHRLNVAPERCLVFEDSPNGVQAALSVGMKCVSVPQQLYKENSVVHQADLVLASLSEFTEAHWNKLNGQ